MSELSDGDGLGLSTDTNGIPEPDETPSWLTPNLIIVLSILLTMIICFVIAFRCSRVRRNNNASEDATSKSTTNMMGAVSSSAATSDHTVLEVQMTAAEATSAMQRESSTESTNSPIAIKQIPSAAHDTVYEAQFANLMKLESGDDQDGEDDGIPSMGAHNPTAPPPAVQQQPSIDADLDAELDEPEDQKARRLQWIRYYVQQGDTESARTLGWDGRPFKLEDVAHQATLAITFGKKIQNLLSTAKTSLQKAGSSGRLSLTRRGTLEPESVSE